MEVETRAAPAAQPARPAAAAAAMSEMASCFMSSLFSTQLKHILFFR